MRRLQKRYKVLLHCGPGNMPIQNHQEIHSQRGLHAARASAGRGRGAGRQRLSLPAHPFRVFHDLHAPHAALSAALAMLCGCGREPGCGLLVCH